MKSQKFEIFPSRKGMMASTLAKLILFLVIALILIVFIGKVALFGKERSDVEICRLSVLAASKTKLIGKPMINSIQCETRNIKVDEKGIYNNNKKIETFRKFDTEKGKTDAEKKIKKIISDELYNCWYQFGQGQLNVFGDWGGSTKKCFICSDIKFNEKINSRIQSIDLTSFMAETKLPNINKTYLQYLGVDPKTMGPVRYKVDTSKSYVAVFTISKWGSFGQAWKYELGGSTAGALIGAKVGASIGALFGGVGALPGATAGLIIGGGAAFVYQSIHTNEWATGWRLDDSNELPKFCDELY